MHFRLFFKYNALGIATMLAVLFFCLTPTTIHIKDLGFFEFDKLVHFGIYFVLTLLNSFSLRKYYLATGRPGPALFSAAVASFFWGIMIEFLQEWLPTGRFFEWYDMLANTLGLLAAVVFALLLRTPVFRG